MGGEENEWIARQKKNKYEPITNPASKTSDVGQGVQMSTMVTDNTALRCFTFICPARLIYLIHIAVIKKQ
jgi:hypothetical protein